jgi:hypothetical protein
MAQTIVPLNVPINVSISTQTAAVKSGTKIRIDVTETNLSDHAVITLKDPGPDGDAEVANYIEVRDSSGNKLPVRRPKLLTIKRLPLAAGQSIHDFMILSDFVDLSAPGTYSVWVRHELEELDQPDPILFVPSNELLITVEK